MIVGVLRVEFSLPGSRSLKDKRRLVQSLVDRLHHEFHVAAAEVNHQDNMRRAELGIACVSSAARHANAVLSRVVDVAERETDMVLVHYDIEMR